ncbi:hypothetical protein J6590_028181 [Homalodisca vitripennis]|nr:hypothetical protein J6590_028181 [Homalodisca vitripennis]
MSVKEAYQQFIKETGMHQVTKTTFYELRPKYVLLRKKTSQGSPAYAEDVYSSNESDDEEICTPTILPNGDEEIAVGSWVAVIYDSPWYPGIVEKKSEQDSGLLHG